jgi:multiple sugar transport system permease protein
MSAISVPEAGVRPVTVVSPPRRIIPFGRVALYTVLVLGSVVAALPFLWMIFGAFKTGTEIREIPPTFIPQDWTWENFTTILDDPTLPLATFYRNSLFVALTNVVMTLVTSSLLGFIFAKYAFRGREVLFWYLMAMMMVPPSVLMIPNYLILSDLGLLNNLWGLVVTVLVDPFAVLVMRQFIRSLPDEQIESARVDGASEFRIYRSVVLPQVKPALATLGLLTFMFHWNAYLWPLIVLSENSKRTIPVILTWYSTQHSAQTNLVMAASVLMVVPVLIFFLVSQRWIVSGLTLTGGK